jgi:hypothetical protein
MDMARVKKMTRQKKKKSESAPIKTRITRYEAYFA